MNTRAKLRRLFRTWCNDYLTVQQFAEHHGIDRARANRIIDTGRVLHNRHARLKS